MPDLHTDPEREHRANLLSTGICVKAKDAAGKWGSHDIAVLDGPSLLEWLKSRGGENQFAEDVVLILLGHRPEEVRVQAPAP